MPLAAIGDALFDDELLDEELPPDDELPPDEELPPDDELPPDEEPPLDEEPPDDEPPLDEEPPDEELPPDDEPPLDESLSTAVQLAVSDEFSSTAGCGVNTGTVCCGVGIIVGTADAPAAPVGAGVIIRVFSFSFIPL